MTKIQSKEGKKKIEKRRREEKLASPFYNRLPHGARELKREREREREREKREREREEMTSR